jgi:hypothetical protein
MQEGTDEASKITEPLKTIYSRFLCMLHIKNAYIDTCDHIYLPYQDV